MYMISEKRKQYLQEWRKNNRQHVNEYLKNYLKVNNKKYRYPYSKGSIYKKVPDELFRGTSALGRKYEKIALSLLNGAEDLNATSFRGKHDILWNGMMIDVKMRNKNKDSVYHFTRKKTRADFYLLFCVANEVIVKAYFLPGSVFGGSVNISESGTKYDNFLVNFTGGRNGKETDTKGSARGSAGKPAPR